MGITKEVYAMDEMEVRYERVPLAGFEDDYARYVDRKASIEAEVKEEFERVLAERTAKLDQLIDLTSELVEIHEEVVEEENTEVVE